MVKVSPANIDPSARLFARGAFYIRQTKWGWIAQKWPTPRGKPKRPYDFYRQTEFGIASRWVASPFASEYDNAKELAKGSPQVWRDILVMAAFGSLARITLADGTTSKQARNVTNNPQYMLDLITDEVGAMLYRAEIGWVALPPGNNGDVLTEVLNVPTWLPGYNLPNMAFIQAMLELIGNTQGDVLYFDGADWVALPVGDDGKVLTVNGAIPEWIAPPNPTGQAKWQLISTTTVTNPSARHALAIGAYNEVMIDASGLTASAAGTRRLQLSVDGGSTYFTASGDYVLNSNAGTTAAQNALVISTGSTALTRTIWGWLQQIKASAAPRAAMDASGQVAQFVASSSAITHIAIANSTGNLTGGTVNLWAR